MFILLFLWLYKFLPCFLNELLLSVMVGLYKIQMCFRDDETKIEMNNIGKSYNCSEKLQYFIHCLIIYVLVYLYSYST